MPDDRIKQFMKDKDELFRIGAAAVRKICQRAIKAVSEQVGDQTYAITKTALLKLKPFEQLIADAMIASHLMGRYRNFVRMSVELSKRQMLSGYSDAVSFVQRKMDLSAYQLAQIESMYGPYAIKVHTTAIASIEAELTTAVNTIITQGQHVSEGVATMRAAFMKAGIAETNPFLLETIVRTQTQIAYGAGRWNANNAHEIQDILWGYEYVTVGDNRVRPNHEALDGTALPKEDPQWAEIWPPNGFNCRCDVIEIFKDDKELAKQKDPEAKEIDGALAEPVPDKGWAFNPGQIFVDVIKR